MGIRYSLRPLVDTGLLLKGDILVSALTNYPGLAEITENAEMRILYPLDSAGKTYDTPSPAGAAITRYPVNGWKTWAVVRLKNRHAAAKNPIPRHIYFGQGISERKLKTILLDDLRRANKKARNGLY